MNSLPDQLRQLARNLTYNEDAQAVVKHRLHEIAAELDKPIDMVLHCPTCTRQHIDAATATWTNPIHRSHRCAGCGRIWRPADVPTNGVAAVKTRGKDDS